MSFDAEKTLLTDVVLQIKLCWWNGFLAQAFNQLSWLKAQVKNFLAYFQSRVTPAEREVWSLLTSAESGPGTLTRAAGARSCRRQHSCMQSALVCILSHVAAIKDLTIRPFLHSGVVPNQHWMAIACTCSQHNLGDVVRAELCAAPSVPVSIVVLPAENIEVASISA